MAENNADKWDKINEKKVKEILLGQAINNVENKFKDANLKVSDFKEKVKQRHKIYLELYQEVM